MGEQTPKPPEPRSETPPTPAPPKKKGWTGFWGNKADVAKGAAEEKEESGGGWTGFWQKRMVADAENDENTAKVAIDLLAAQNNRLLDMQEKDATWKRAVVTTVVIAFLLIVAAGIGLGTGTLKLPGGAGELKTAPRGSAPVEAPAPAPEEP